MGETLTGAVGSTTTIPKVDRTPAPCPANATVAVGKWLGQAESEIGQLFSFAYRSSRNASDRLLQRLQNRARQLRRERPLPLLWAVSGCAFALGISLAIWRSRR